VEILAAADTYFFGTALDENELSCWSGQTCVRLTILCLSKEFPKREWAK